MKHELVIVLDFGGQYNQLIARRVRECGVYCEILSYKTPVSVLKEKNPVGIILTGGPNSVYEPSSPTYSAELTQLGIPVLGICYGCQLLAHLCGGKVETASTREYGKTPICHNESLLFHHIPAEFVCWMSHTDYISQIPDGFTISAFTEGCPVAAMENAEQRIYGVQFHPEVLHTQYGTQLIDNFLTDICCVAKDWSMKEYAKEAIAALREKIGNKKVLCALSGGVDSSVAAMLIEKAVGSQLTCIFVDHGLLRKDEGDQVAEVFGNNTDLHFVRVNAQSRFLNKLKNISEPEMKRKIIGEEFIRVFEDEAKKLGKVDFLVQGTIYPDVVESGCGEAAVIKSHHNVGALPDCVDFEEIIEPLRNLFKDEVRALGTELGLSDALVWRQPFPGPGLAVRIIGDITQEKIEILQNADAIFREEIINAKLDRVVNQYFAVLTNMKSVGVMGDGRTYEYTIALRGVSTTDFMTADWARIPYDVLEKTSNRIINEVKHVNRIVYDITSKPPATIEWE